MTEVTLEQYFRSSKCRNFRSHYAIDPPKADSPGDGASIEILIPAPFLMELDAAA